MSKRRWSYPSATVTAQRSDEIGICQVTGIVTPAASGQILADNHLWIRESQIFGQVAIYQGATMCVDEEGLMRSAIATMSRASEILRPTALVVNAEQLPLFQRYAWLAAQHGFSRAAFTETEPALEWVRRQAEVFAQWPAMRLPASAECSETSDASAPVRPESDRA